MNLKGRNATGTARTAEKTPRVCAASDFPDLPVQTLLAQTLRAQQMPQISYHVKTHPVCGSC